MASNHRANQLNPNNANYWKSRSSKDKNDVRTGAFHSIR